MPEWLWWLVGMVGFLAAMMLLVYIVVERPAAKRRKKRAKHIPFVRPRWPGI